MKTSILNLSVLVFYAADDFTDLLGELYSLMWGWVLGAFLGGAFLWGAWVASKFMFSGGDEQKVIKAKAALKNFVIGIIIALVLGAALPTIVAAIMNAMN